MIAASEFPRPADAETVALLGRVKTADPNCKTCDGSGWYTDIDPDAPHCIDDYSCGCRDLSAGRKP